MAESPSMDRLQASGLDSKIAEAIRDEIRSAVEAAFRKRATAAPSQPQEAERQPTASGSRVDWTLISAFVALAALILGLFYWQDANFNERMQTFDERMQTEFASIRAEIASIRAEIGSVRDEMGASGASGKRSEACWQGFDVRSCRVGGEAETSSPR